MNVSLYATNLAIKAIKEPRRAEKRRGKSCGFELQSDNIKGKKDDWRRRELEKPEG